MNNKFKLIYLNIFKLLAFILPYEVAYGQVHPFLLKDEPEMYSEAYFGMAFEDFKSKFTNKIIECKVNPSKVLMDKGCKVSFNFSGGATEGVAAFKDDKFVGIVAKVNSDKYDNLNSDFSNIFKTSPQIENREEKKGIFSEKISNQYSFWRFPDYLLAINGYS